MSKNGEQKLGHDLGQGLKSGRQFGCPLSCCLVRNKVMGRLGWQICVQATRTSIRPCKMRSGQESVEFT